MAATVGNNLLGVSASSDSVASTSVSQEARTLVVKSIEARDRKQE